MAGFEPRRLVSEGERLECLHLAVPRARGGIVWGFGAGSGFHGPAGGLYDRLGGVLGDEGVASLQVAWRRRQKLAPAKASVRAVRRGSAQPAA